MSAECIAEWKSHAERLKFKKTVSHDSYLINLAATNPEFWRKSIELFVEELNRCRLLLAEQLADLQPTHRPQAPG